MAGNSDIDRLVEMMVGRRLEDAATPGQHRARLVVLEVKDIQLVRNGPHNSFQLHQGEILGFGLVQLPTTDGLGHAQPPSVNKEVWLLR